MFDRIKPKMKKTWIRSYGFVAFLLLFSFLLCGTNPLHSQTLPHLIPKLDSMVSADQAYRELLQRMSKEGNKSANIEQTRSQLRHIDEQNYYEIVTYFYEHGFLGYDKVGEEGSNNFWLLVQHQTEHPEFQEKVLLAMEKEVMKDNADRKNYVYLLDWVKMVKGEAQVYGSQLRLNKEADIYEVYNLEDPEHVNERRSEIGLEPIEDYVQKVNAAYGKGTEMKDEK